MASQAKAQAIMRDLADKLTKRFAAGAAGINTVRSANDANGWPMIFLSHNANEAEAQPVILLRMIGQDMVSKDVFGNALTAYAPHLMQVAYELAAANKPEATLADLFTVHFEAIKVGARSQECQIANGTAVTEASLNAAVAAGPQADVDELYWPSKSV